MDNTQKIIGPGTGSAPRDVLVRNAEEYFKNVLDTSKTEFDNVFSSHDS